MGNVGSFSPAADTHPDRSSQTRAALLDVAEHIFADRGYRATSVRAITQEAGCNLAAINYHFGGKAKLYQEVFRRRLAAMRESRIARVRRTMEEAGEEASLDLLLEAFVGAFVEPLIAESTGRHWLRLLARELLDPQLPVRMFHAEMVEPVHEVMIEALARVAPGLDESQALLCVQSLEGQLVHFVNLHRFCSRSRGVRAIMAFSLAEAMQHVRRFSRAGILALASGQNLAAEES